MSTLQRPLPPIIPLAQFGPVTFAQITGVFAVHDDGRLRYHCSPEEWPSTPEAQVASLDAEIAEAQARLAALTASREAMRPTSLLLPAPPAEGEKPKTKARRTRCKACGKLLVHGFFLRHVEREHTGQDPADLEYHEDLPWPILAAAEPPAPMAGHDLGNA